MDFQLKSDQDLIHLYISGEEGGLIELIRRYHAVFGTFIVVTQYFKNIKLITVAN